MFDKIIAYSIRNKVMVGIMITAWIAWGVYSLTQLPIDAVPDITDNQVQIITISPTLATLEVEQFITAPVELALQNLPQIVQIRSISRFGLSVVTVVFEENMDLYLARQLVNEQLKEAEEAIPPGLGTPEMGPISTGLGEIYQYVIRPEKGKEGTVSPSELRSIQDWIVKRQLSGIKGVIEVNSFGGYLKQYEVAVDQGRLKSMDVTISEVFEALANSNQNTGGAYIEKDPSTFYIRSEGLFKSLNDIGQTVVRNTTGTPILVSDIATVQYGKAPRYGAMTANGEEVVGGIVMMLKGANSAKVTERIKERVVQVRKSLPDGVVLEPFLDREKLVNTTIGTVQKNLLEGGLIVIFILVLMLGSWRAGLIVASVIPLAMLFAVSMMNIFGISANLMSLGAIDFGLIVDGAVIIVEAIMHRLQSGFGGKTLSREKMNQEVLTASQKIRNSAAFGEIIILMVYIPILALVGIEGKMFKPMAQTVIFAIIGALILSLTYVPMMAAWVLKKEITQKKTIADKIIAFFQRMYTPILEIAMRFKMTFVLATVLIFSFSIFIFSRMGGEFIPTLEEGDLAMHQILPPGSSLSKSVEISKMIQKKLKSEFPEIIDIVAKIGSAEVPTDPMPVEIGDVMLIMKPKSEWTSAKTRQELYQKLEHSLENIPGVGYEFSQPIQMRFNELMTGTRADIAIKLYGEDLDLLYQKAKEAESIIADVEGIASAEVEQTIGMPQIFISFDYGKMARYGVQVNQVNTIIRSAFAGEKAGVVYEGEKRFDLVVRLDESSRRNISDVENLYIDLANGIQIPLREIANISLKDGPMQISRENTQRRIVIGVNARSRDVQTMVKDIQQKLDAEVDLPAGYFFTYGGQFENLKSANERLMVAVPLALALIFILLYFTFGSLPHALLIFVAIPLSAIGGIWALYLRGMPFSISAGIGFIALFGVAVLNGIVLIGYFDQLKKEGMMNIRERIFTGTSVRLRPVILTASVASLGFLPMALSTSGGSEVQRPLATVVIGGLITATFLTLFILPILYSWIETRKQKVMTLSGGNSTAMILLALMTMGLSGYAQQTVISPEEATQIALENHPSIQAADLNITKQEGLQDIKYNLGSTEVYYEGDGLFSTNPQLVNAFGISQNFPNPQTQKSRNALNLGQLELSQIQKTKTAASVKMQVKTLYYTLQQKKNLKKVYNRLSEEYAVFAEIARKRAETGAANPLDFLSVNMRLEEFRLLGKQASREVASLTQQFNQLLMAADAYTVSDSLEMMTDPGSVNLSGAPDILFARQQIDISTAEKGMLKSLRLPSLDLGYSAQNYWESGWLSGLRAGIQLPLFNTYQSREIQSSEIQIQVDQKNAEAMDLQWQQKQLELRNAIEMYREGAHFYKKQLTAVSPEIIRISKLNYEAGEITAFQYLEALTLWADMNKNYLGQVLSYNQSVIQLYYLAGQ